MDTNSKKEIFNAVKKSYEDKQIIKDFIQGKIDRNILIARGIKFGRPI